MKHCSRNHCFHYAVEVDEFPGNGCDAAMTARPGWCIWIRSSWAVAAYGRRSTSFVWFHGLDQKQCALLPFKPHCFRFHFSPIIIIIILEQTHEGKMWYEKHIHLILEPIRNNMEQNMSNHSDTKSSIVVSSTCHHWAKKTETSMSKSSRQTCWCEGTPTVRLLTRSALLPWRPYYVNDHNINLNR